MERVDRILSSEDYLQQLALIEKLEANRIYCRHGLPHLLDVARVMYIRVLEDNLSLPKDVVYAAALLHDLGRGIQYETGRSHDEAGVQLAERILPACGFDPEETAIITDAIGEHRQSTGTSDAAGILGRLLKEADHETRLCFVCGARESCHWNEARKNKGIRM